MQVLRVESWGRAIGSVLTVCVLILVCQPAAFCQRSTSLSGRVTTRDGVTIPFGVTVTLRTNAGQLVVSQPVDSAGHFEIDGLQRIDYRMVVTAKGFRPAELDADLRYSGGSVTINVQLTPEPTRRPNKGAVTSVAELRVPAAARNKYQKGSRAFQQRRYSVAQRYFEQATQDYPCYARAQVDLATVLIIRKTDSVGAETRLRKAIQCDATFLDAYIELAQLLNAKGQYKQSVKVLRQGMQHSPDAWQFHFQLGVANYGMKNYSEAEKELGEVSRLNKTPPPILYVKLADVYLRESKYPEAYSEMEKYLRKDPEGRFAPKIHTVMKEMRAAGVLSAEKPAQR
jgi:tetratricopeptide (TPR) repeat protein